MARRASRSSSYDVGATSASLSLSVRGVGLVDGVDVLGGHDLACGVEPQAVVGEGGVGRPPCVGEQAEQEVVGTDLGVAQLAGDVRRLGDGDPGFGVESGLHGCLLESLWLPPLRDGSRGSASGEPPGG